jgi:hypothetical protein
MKPPVRIDEMKVGAFECTEGNLEVSGSNENVDVVIDTGAAAAVQELRQDRPFDDEPRHADVR